MYDKVKLFSMRTRDTGDVSQYLNHANEQTDLKTGEMRIYGSLNGLRISIYPGGISILGSLAKFIHDANNIYTLDRKSTKEAIAAIEDSLHLKLEEAKVTELEFGTCFVMRHPVSDYLNRLGNVPKLLRCNLETGSVYYKHLGKEQPKVFTFYDKGIESTNKGMALPIGMEDANLLRYEIRYKGHLAKQFNTIDVTASTLSDKRFYGEMVKRYQDIYFRINKIHKNGKFNMDGIKTASQAMNVLLARLLSESDNRYIDEFIHELRASKMDRQDIYRFKQKIDKIAIKTNGETSDELIKELDDDIKNVGAYY